MPTMGRLSATCVAEPRYRVPAALAPAVAPVRHVSRIATPTQTARRAPLLVRGIIRSCPARGVLPARRIREYGIDRDLRAHRADATIPRKRSKWAGRQVS